MEHLTARKRMDSTEALLAATQQLGNAVANYNDYRQGEEALEQNQNQFSANLEELKREYDSTMAFANLQHSEQMDFANRQLQANQDIANQNFNLSKEYQEKNFGLQQQAFDYQKFLNSTMMEREDNAIQRQIADYTAAGFSPLAAIGGNGAAAGSMSTHSPSQINAPQYDMSGINQAAGVYADFAKQYSALSMTARQDFSRNRSQLAEKHNSEITASRIALQQMRADMRYKNQAASTQLFNAAVNYKDSLLNREYVRQQTDSLKKETSWNEKHGYRNTNPYSDIARAIESIIPALEKNHPKVNEVTEKVKEAYEEQKIASSAYYESPKKASEALLRLSNFLESQEINYNPFTAEDYYNKNSDVRNIYTLDEFKELLKKGKTGTIQRALVRQALRGGVNF